MRRRALLVLLALPLAGCKAPDPAALLEVSEVETYWAIDRARGTTNYLAPAVRYRLRNKSAEPTRSIQATATFRRRNEPNVSWGSAWEQITPAGQPLQPGDSVVVLMKSDARYYSEGPPETFFQHPQFKDANVEVYLRVGPSGWVKFAANEIDRRVGSKSVEQFANSGEPPIPTPPTPSPRTP